MFILYTTEDGKNQIQIHAADDTVSLSPSDISEILNAGLHLKTLYED